MTKRRNASKAELLNRNARLERPTTPGSVVVYLKRRGWRRVFGRTETKMYRSAVADVVPTPISTLLRISQQDDELGRLVYLIDWSDVDRVVTASDMKHEEPEA